MTTGNVLAMMGWIFLIASWLVPYVMKKMNKDDMKRHTVGMVLAASSIGFFVSELIIALMK